MVCAPLARCRDFWGEWAHRPLIAGCLADGLEVRIGRYPDIEAQLAPNNITDTHSLTYTWDNYTNKGIVTSGQINKNILVQLGITDGTETPIWNCCRSLPILFGPNLLYPGLHYRRDPGQPALCHRLPTPRVERRLGIPFYPCIDGINNTAWGYNNLQWHGFTYYHPFNDQWHIDFESYFLSKNGVPNLRNPTAVNTFANGGTAVLPAKRAV
jgi:hypothetical protein